MSNPQQPELARSRKTPSQDQDAVAGVVEGQRQPRAEGPAGPVPAGNQPGHHPAEEQDKPDLDAFAARLGITDAPADNGAAPARDTAETAPPATAGSGPIGPRAPARPSFPPGPTRNRRMARFATAGGLLVAALLIRRRRRSRKA